MDVQKNLSHQPVVFDMSPNGRLNVAELFNNFSPQYSTKMHTLESLKQKMLLPMPEADLLMKP